MRNEPTPLDISHVPELLRLAEEVKSSRTPRLLRRDGEDVAVLAPVRPARRRRVKRGLTDADREAFLSSFGAWKGLVDGEALKRKIAESRAMPPRPRPEL